MIVEDNNLNHLSHRAISRKFIKRIGYGIKKGLADFDNSNLLLDHWF